jgi:hypothetical protein
MNGDSVFTYFRPTRAEFPVPKQGFAPRPSAYMRRKRAEVVDSRSMRDGSKQDGGEGLSSGDVLVSLKLQHPSRSLVGVPPADIVPEVAWNIGDVWRTPKGTGRNEVRTNSYWCVGIWSEAELEIGVLLTKSVEQLVCYMRVDDGYFESGGSIGLDMFVEVPSGGKVFNKELLRLLSMHRIDLGLELGCRQRSSRGGFRLT